jgi:hypothetical protein
MSTKRGRKQQKKTRELRDQFIGCGGDVYRRKKEREEGDKRGKEDLSDASCSLATADA